jgi:hypothetical protein
MGPDGLPDPQWHPAREDLVFQVFRFKRVKRKNQHSFFFAANIMKSNVKAGFFLPSGESLSNF